MIPRESGFFFHVPNQGKRSRLVGQQFKGMGMLPGLTDLVFVARRYRKAAVTGFDAVAGFMELKNPTFTGDLHKAWSSDQADFRDLCNGLGFAWCVLNDLDHIVEWVRGFYEQHGLRVLKVHVP